MLANGIPENVCVCLFVWSERMLLFVTALDITAVLFIASSSDKCPCPLHISAASSCIACVHLRTIAN